MTGPTLAARLSGAAEREPRPAPAVETEPGARAQWRVMLVAAGFLIGFSAVALRMGALALATPSEPRIAATDAARHVSRAPIVDRAGRPLALNLPAWSVYAHPREMIDADEAALKLAGALEGVEAERLKARFARSSAFAWIKRPISPEEKQAVHDLGLPGVHFGAREHRVYPAGRIAAHILGGARAGREGVRFAETEGLAGVERRRDAALRDPAREGAPFRLTIDLAAQAALTEVLDEAVARFGAIGAAGVLMEARTGRVVAMTSLPDFDPNRRPDPHAPEVERDRPLLNRAAGGVYELGSTFKPIFAALAIDAGLVTPETPLDAKGPLIWAGRAIRDFHRMPPIMTVTEAMAESSNVATARLALMVGTPRAQDFLERLGFFEPTSIELAEAGLGQPLLPARWTDLSTITISYGHGLAATPLHLAAAYAALANGGLRVRPTLDPDSPLPGEADRVISAATSEAMRRILRTVVTEGTGGFAEAPGYEVGGKTGTADKPKPGGGYYDKKVISSFAGVFPSSDPQYVLVVTLDEPEDRSGRIFRRTAGWTAAPVAGAAIARLAPLLGLRPAAPEPAPGASLDVAARN